MTDTYRTKTYFISDAHLGAAYIADPREHERRIAHMLDEMRGDAKAVYMLGDMIDFWFEYRNVVPRGYTRFFAAITRLTDSGIPVYWFKGNHDMWTQGYLADELGVTVIDNEFVTEIDGHRFYMAHGDAEGPQKTGYRILRAIFRNKVCRRIGSALHPRLLLGFGNSWSCSNRRRHDPNGIAAPYCGDDCEPQMIFARKYSASHPDIEHYVFGHRHIALQRRVPGSNALLTVLGDCFRGFHYAVFDGKKMELKQKDSVQA